MKKEITNFILLLFLGVIFCVDASSQELTRKGQKTNGANYSENSLGILPMSAGVTVQQMVENLLGQGITYSNVQYSGAQIASGLFSGGNSAGINIEEGVILSCGAAEYAIGPNNSTGISQVNNLPGDSDLNNLGYSTNDASVLEFDFIPELDYISFNFVVGSEEYPEYISGYQDVFAFFLDGENIALIPGTNTAISIGTVNHLTNSEYYISNSDSPPLYDIQCDGFTVVFELVATVTPNVNHHIKMAVADVNDSALDTWIFLERGSFVSANPGIAVEPVELDESLCSNATSSQYLTLVNDGTGELNFTINESVSWLSVNPVSGTIQESESIQIEVTFNALGTGSGTYQTSLQIENNTPQNPINIPIHLEVIPISTDIYIDQDNENNDMGGIPDGDFNTYLCKGDDVLPIEFNLTIQESFVLGAELIITTFDVDILANNGLPYSQKDEVFVNGNFIGILEGNNNIEGETIFNIPSSILIEGPNGQNLIQVFVSVEGKYWCLQLNSAELLVTHCQGEKQN